MKLKKRNKQNMLIQYKENDMKYWNMRCNNSPKLILKQNSGLVLGLKYSLTYILSVFYFVLIKGFECLPREEKTKQKNRKQVPLCLWLILWLSDHVNHVSPTMGPRAVRVLWGQSVCWSGAEVLSTHLAGLPDRCMRPPQSGPASHHYTTWPFAHIES